MKVLLNDGLDKDGIKLFESAGIGIDAKKRDLSKLVQEIGQFDALIVRSSTIVTREVLKEGAQGSLKIVGRAGVGFDNIDVDAASEYGVVVKYAPFGNTNAAAEIALGLMLAVSRNIPQAHYTLKNRVWRKKDFVGSEISHKTLGIIGCGRVGQRLAQLTMGFDMHIVGFDEYPERVQRIFPESRIKYVPKDEVMSQADYLSVHTGGNGVVIGHHELSMMKPTAYLVNTSRGPNVDQEALYNALKGGRIKGAGLDVYEEEPQEGKPFTNKLTQLENIVFTSHLGASSLEAQRKTSAEMARVVIDYLVSGSFENAVNVGESIESERKPVHPLFIHHKDIPGAFAQINTVLGDAGINIRENPSRQLGKDGSVITIYQVHQKIEPPVLERLRNLGIVYSARL